MKTVGIIAEYNPFHKGHEYQIKQIRKQTGAEHIVVVMSGDFVQRGTPAWTDKYLRAKMALAGGADMVFELPVHFATASAEGFAHGAIHLLNSLKFIDGVCFSSECGDLDALSTIATYLNTHAGQTQEMIRDKLTKGHTYPAARAQILTEAFPRLIQKHAGLLTEPNNILAIEYLKAMYHQDSPMTPITITRQGAGYHETAPDQEFPSATAIRSYYARTASLPDHGIPDYVQTLLTDHSDHFPMTENDFSEMLYYKIRTSNENALAIHDMTPELWRRIQKQLPHFQTATQFAGLLKTKQYTQTRIQRVLLHLLLDLKPMTASAAYARLLGFRQSHSRLLRHETDIPVLTKVADSETLLTTETAQMQFQADLRAHDLYRYMMNQKYPTAKLPDDYHAGICIIS